MKVLLSPLDWGLGHAARCIPIVKELRDLGCRVVIAASKGQAEMFLQEFPGIEIKVLKGYNIRYSAGASLFKSLLLQLPGIFRTIQYEHRWLNSLLQQENFDLIISDNRPGFWNKQVRSVYITHQLIIHSGKGKWLNRLLQKLHTRYIKQFSEVWVPDLEGEKNLAGELSHPLHPLVSPIYIGPLSRLEKNLSPQKKIDLLVLLSGPEPQRTLLEQTIVQELKSFTGNACIVRGLSQHKDTLARLPPHIVSYNHLPAAKLQTVIASSAIIICRSGYTTIMDLIKLNKKAFLIPTPGQPEQEYLARYMQDCSYFPFLEQKNFHLEDALKNISSFQYRNPFTEAEFNQYKKITGTI